ncbi:MAG: hypothetical protein CL424_19535 [Acidimicrobiaceae bacterium]|nr:hypothetical protein [Acidimicrobiaceae bacterium]
MREGDDAAESMKVRCPLDEHEVRPDQHGTNEPMTIDSNDAPLVVGAVVVTFVPEIPSHFDETLVEPQPRCPAIHSGRTT